jgi:hypothetical protein
MTGCRNTKRAGEDGIAAAGVWEIRQMLKKGEYDYDRDVQNHETKMTQYHKFPEKEKNERNLKKPA